MGVRGRAPLWRSRDEGVGSGGLGVDDVDEGEIICDDYEVEGVMVNLEGGELGVVVSLAIELELDKIFFL